MGGPVFTAPVYSAEARDLWEEIRKDRGIAEDLALQSIEKALKDAEDRGASRVCLTLWVKGSAHLDEIPLGPLASLSIGVDRKYPK